MINCLNVLWVLIPVALIVFIYYQSLKNTSTNIASADILNRFYYICPFTNEWSSLWPVSHFVAFALVGFLFPQSFIFIAVAGIIWESFESIVEIFIQQTTTVDENVEYTIWWGSLLKDIAYNLAGYLVGASLAVMIRGIDVCQPECMGILNLP
jgi:hypothetical protein